MQRITILLADHNTLVRREVRRILDLEDDLQVVGQTKDGREAVALVKKLCPAIVLMEIGLPRLNGLEATRQILEAVPATKVILLAAHTDEAYVEAAINTGAMGYLLKQTCGATVCPAIREVQKGKTCFSPSIPRRLHQRNRKQ